MSSIHPTDFPPKKKTGWASTCLGASAPGVMKAVSAANSAATEAPDTR